MPVFHGTDQGHVPQNMGTSTAGTCSNPPKAYHENGRGIAAEEYQILLLSS